jgi:O-antigen ligase
MFLDRPFTGFGPGTYQFNYVAYQRPGEITYLSTVDPGSPQMITRALSFSDDLMVRQNPQVFYSSGGTAHSEYLLALSEGGIGPFLILLALLGVIIHTGVMYCHQTSSGPERTLVLCITAALIAYHVHAVFNNFLDDCKIAFFYWGMLGMLMYLDVKRARRSAVRSLTDP